MGLSIHLTHNWVAFIFLGSCGFVLNVAFCSLDMFPFTQMVTRSNPLRGIYLSIVCHRHRPSTRLPWLLQPILLFLTPVFVSRQKSAAGGPIDRERLLPACFGLCRCKWPSPFLACSPFSAMGPSSSIAGWLQILGVRGRFRDPQNLWGMEELYTWRSKDIPHGGVSARQGKLNC